jgi:protein TonB
MISLTAEDRSDLRRWICSCALVLLVHASFVVVMTRARQPEEIGVQGTVITMDLMPVPDAAQAAPNDLPPGPEQSQAEASQETPEEKPEEKIEQEVPPAPTPDLSMPLPETKPERAVEPQETVPMTTAPQTRRTNAPSAVPNWRVRVMELLERNKRYPSDARSRRQQGVVQLTVTMDRQGHVTASRVTRSSGFVSLDREALALVLRVQPLPPPPAEIPGPVTLVVPIRFNIR